MFLRLWVRAPRMRMVSMGNAGGKARYYSDPSDVGLGGRFFDRVRRPGMTNLFAGRADAGLDPAEAQLSAAGSRWASPMKPGQPNLRPTGAPLAQFPEITLELRVRAHRITPDPSRITTEPESQTPCTQSFLQ